VASACSSAQPPRTTELHVWTGGPGELEYYEDDGLPWNTLSGSSFSVPSPMNPARRRCSQVPSRGITAVEQRHGESSRNRRIAYDRQNRELRGDPGRFTR
jgi:hypothetical protein